MKKSFTNAFLLGLLTGLCVYLVLDSWVFPKLLSPPGQDPGKDEVHRFILVEMTDQLDQSRARIVELESQLQALRKEAASPDPSEN